MVKISIHVIDVGADEMVFNDRGSFSASCISIKTT